MLRHVGCGEAVKSMENDNRLVDYLYDELPQGESQSLRAEVEADAEVAKQVSSLAALLEIYRRETEEITPSVAATEKILAEATRATQPWYSVLFGQWLMSAVLRPSVGIIAATVLVLGIGVFVFHSGRSTSDGSEGGPTQVASARESEVAASCPEESLAEAPAPAPAPGLLVMDEREKATSGEPQDSEDQAAALAIRDRAGKDDRPGDLVVGEGTAAGADRLAVPQSAARELERQKTPSGGYYRTSANQDPSRGGGNGLPATGAVRGEKAQRAFQLKSEVVSKAPASREGRFAKSEEGKVAEDRAPRRPLTGLAGGSAPGAPPPQASPSVQARLRDRSIDAKEGAVGGASQEQPAQTTKRQVPPTTQSAPVLYNLATTTLNRGRVAEACDLFASLVRTHRDSPRRPDALLGWARCEMARGAYGRAETIINTLIKDHPDWRKSGETWIAEIQKQRQQAVLRAQRRARQQRKATRAAPARKAPSRATSYE